MLLQAVTGRLHSPLLNSVFRCHSCEASPSAPRPRPRLLPALAVGQGRLLLARDEGGAPDRAAVAVPEPAHGRRGRVLRGAEAMVRLGFSSQRRGGAPHHRGGTGLRMRLRSGSVLSHVFAKVHRGILHNAASDWIDFPFFC